MVPHEEQLTAAEKPAEMALRLHAFYKGKVQVMPKCSIRDYGDFAVWYTPGVAAPCRAICDEPELVYEYTNKANSIAIVSDGTRVPGLTSPKTRDELFDTAVATIKRAREAARLLLANELISPVPEDER